MCLRERERERVCVCVNMYKYTGTAVGHTNSAAGARNQPCPQAASDVGLHGAEQAE